MYRMNLFRLCSICAILLTLAACGGGGNGTPINGRSYAPGTLVLKVIFEDLNAFTMLSTSGDSVTVDVSLDVNDNGVVDTGDLSVRYFLELIGVDLNEEVQLRRYISASATTPENSSDVIARLSANILEFEVPQSLHASLSNVSSLTQINVAAVKSTATPSTDYLPDEDVYSTNMDNSSILDVIGDSAAADISVFRLARY